MAAYRRYGAIAAWLLCAAFLSCSMRVFGNHQLGAADANIIIDAAWRMFIGQKPYVDFHGPLSPEFYVGAGWAYSLWGVSWSALVRISMVVAVVTFALHSIALSQFMPRRYAIAVALVCQMLAMMVTSYWWYNSTASITACLLFSVSFGLVTRPASRTLAIIFCVALMMMSVMKANIAAVSILAVLIPLVTVRELRPKLFVWVAGSALVVLGLLIACDLNPVDIVRAYLEMAGTRGLPDARNFLRSKPNEAFISLPLIGACLAAFTVVCRQIYSAPRGNRPGGLGRAMFVASSGILVGGLCMLMSSELSLISGVPLILVSTSSLILWVLDERIVGTKVPVALVFGVLMCACATLLGLVLFETLPVSTLVGRIGLTWPYMALLMAWSFFAAMSAGAFAASISGLSFSTRWDRLLERVARWPVALVILLVTAAAAAYDVSARRIIVRSNGLDVFYSNNPAVDAGLPFFRGFSASPSLKAAAEQIETVLSQYERQGYRKSNIFFGTRLEFAYAAFDIPSPTHLPVWWGPHAAYPPSDEPEMVERFAAHQFPLCIFHGNDPEFGDLPAGIIEQLGRDYRRVSYSELTVFVRNN